MIDTQPKYARARDLTLNQALWIWLRELQPKFLILHLLGWIGYRVYLLGHGDWGGWDLLVIAGLLALHPFAEWIIHVFILHHRPRKLLGLRWDYHAARMHRLHHRDPWDLRFVLMPLPIMVLGLALGVGVFWLITPTAGAWATAMVMTAGLSAYYEWVHFLTHTSYRAKGRIYERQWRLHRLHHFKNERYWMGVTRHFGDVVLGTLPAVGEVETSKTARTLGLLDDTPDPD